MGATMWRPDPIEAEERNWQSHRHLHRMAMDRGWWCSTKKSNIDKRYYAEMNFNVHNPDGSYKHTHFNMKLGTGDSPLEAAANGYLQAMPDDIVILQAAVAAKLDALLPQIRRHHEARQRYLKLTAALDDLTILIDMVKGRFTAMQSKTANVIIRDEDDDL